MVNYQYTYLIWVGIFLLIWLTLYLWRKDTRKEMFVISFLFGIGGVLSELIYVQDWWQPLTITNTLIGIEDFLIGFFIGGIAAVIYTEIFNKKIKIKKTKQELKRNINFLLVLATLIILFFASFYIFKINSFYSSVIAFLIPIIVIWVKRKDLAVNSIISGFLVLIVGIGVYLILHLIHPGFIKEFWYLQEAWYTDLLFGVPLGEYIWYFLAGAFIGPLYEYWQEGRLINIKN